MRHVYCDPPKPEQCYSNFRLASTTGDHNYIKGNSKYMAFTIASGGGKLAVHSHEKTGRFGASIPVLDGHKGPILDFDFNPFHDQLIATGGDDAYIKVWGIPVGGLESTISEPLVDLQEHLKKITIVQFHPSAEHVLATGSADNTSKVWDVEKGMSKCTTDHGALLQDICWAYDGSVMYTSAKDKLMRAIDPRTGEVTGSVEAHNGSKTSKLTYVAKQNQVISVGFTRQSKRQFKIWDPKKLDTPVCTADLDQAAGVVMPFYDEDSKILFLAGKGDGNIRCFEIVPEDPWQFDIYQYKTSTPQRGVAMLPKRAVDVTKCEIARMLKLTNKDVEPLHFIIPRKSDLFQADIFPDCRSNVKAMSADEFFGGKNATPKLMSLDPKKRKDVVQKESGGMKVVNVASLQKDLDAANKKIAELEAKLKAAGIDP